MELWPTISRLTLIASRLTMWPNRTMRQTNSWMIPQLDKAISQRKVKKEVIAMSQPKHHKWTSFKRNMVWIFVISSEAQLRIIQKMWTQTSRIIRVGSLITQRATASTSSLTQWWSHRRVAKTRSRSTRWATKATMMRMEAPVRCTHRQSTVKITCIRIPSPRLMSTRIRLDIAMRFRLELMTLQRSMTTWQLLQDPRKTTQTPSMWSTVRMSLWRSTPLTHNRPPNNRYNLSKKW